MALRRILADPEFVFRREAEPANLSRRPDLSHQRSGAGFAEMRFVVVDVRYGSND